MTYRPHLSLLMLALAACSTSDTDSPDQGMPDAGHEADASAQDAGHEPDAGQEPDAGEEPDAGLQARAIGVNDVSFLFPIPGEGKESDLLGLASEGAHGVLFPRSLFDTHVQRLWEGPRVEEGYDLSRVTAVRLDPCANHLAIAPETCEAELRLSVQPTFDGTGFLDAGLHLIYRVPRAELEAVLDGMLTERDRIPRALLEVPLGPNPIMVEEGTDGAFATELKRLVLSVIGEARLVKFTFMDRGRNSTNWRFHQLERTGDSFALTAIPATGTEDDQQGVDEIEGFGTLTRSIHPIDEAVGFPTNFLDTEAAKALSAEQQQASLDRLASFEDPARFSSRTLDCGSCHVNTNARESFELLLGRTANQSFELPEKQNGERADQTELASNILLQFGYFGDKLVVSRRVIHESARVADWFANSAL